MIVAAFDLAGDGVRVDHRTALVGGHDPAHAQPTSRAGPPLGAGPRPDRPFPAQQRRPSRAGCPFPARGPAKSCGGGPDQRGQPLVGQVVKPEPQWVGTHRVGWTLTGYPAFC